MKFSTYQNEIFDWVQFGEGNLVVNAVAGSGKTTTIVKAVEKLPLKSNDKVQFFAFNKSIADELKSRLPSFCECSTLHSFGLSILRKSYPGCSINEYKIKNIIEKRKSFVKKDNQNSFNYSIGKFVDLIRMNYCENDSIEKLIDLCFKHDINFPEEEGVVPYERNITFALSILNEANENNTEFDFTDMLYRPIRDNLKIPKKNWILVDECQDLNKIQQMIFLSTMKPDSRFIAVGDPYQAIYGFAGADDKSFQNLQNIENTITLPLSVCYRCDKKIIQFSKLLVPQIEHSETANDGVVRMGSINEITEQDFVLCRNTKPLVVAFFYLIKSGIKATIYSDIGESLTNDLKPFINDNDKFVFINSLKVKRVNLVAKLMKYGVTDIQGNRLVMLMNEKIDLMTFLLEKFENNRQIYDFIKENFNRKDGRGVKLMTIHKSKGLENKTVYVIRYDTIPSQFSRQDWQIQQELNLMYVMFTRAKKELVFVTDWVDVENKYSPNLMRVMELLNNHNFPFKKKNEEVLLTQ